MELHDPHLIGGNYTWFRGISHHSAAKLDRFLNSMEWEESFKAIRQKILPRVVSDHCPIILDVAIGKKMFTSTLRIGGLNGKILMI